MTTPKTIELDANGIRFHAFEKGEGPLALLLHGFPDDATTWTAQLDALAEAGYRAVAPYMRGYAPTSPSPNGSYQTAALGRDILALLDVLSPDAPAFVVGHDWGAIASYAAAVKAPGRIRRLVTLSVPYGPRMNSAFLVNYAQQKRSWYIFFFQTMLADMAVAHDDLAFIRNLWRDWSPTWKFTDADIAPVLATLGAPGGVEAALAYYRCLFNPALLDPDLMDEQAMVGLAPIDVPTLYLHGADDGCMGVEMLDGMEDSFPKGLEKAVLGGCGHFLHREKSEEVSIRIREFLEKG